MASVTIYSLLSNDGLIFRTKQSVEKYKEEEALEKVNMAIVEYEIIMKATNMTEQEKNDKLIEVLNKYGSTEDKGEYIETIVDGYVFWIYKDSLKTEAKGKDGVLDATEIEVKEESKNITVEVGENLEIQLNIKPEGASTRNVEYISSNPEVVKVNNGNIIAVSPGTVEIKIKTKNGKEAICNVTVKEVEVKSISIEPVSLKMKKGNVSESLKVNFTPNNAQNKTITWSSSDTKIATVDAEGKVTAVAEGKCNIKATSSNEKEAICVVIVSDGMTIAEAKEAIAKDGLRAHIGDKVSYSPTAGGTWRIFYYDEAGEFGNENKLYLKRDFVTDKTIIDGSIKDYKASETGIEIMKNMNPLWRDYPTENANVIDRDNERVCSWFYDPINWNDYFVEDEADFAIGGPSLELLIKAHNVWDNDPKDAYNLKCIIKGANGYNVESLNYIKNGPNNIFACNSSNTYWWLCSPYWYSKGDIFNISNTTSDVYNKILSTSWSSRMTSVCPVVCIK